MRSASDKARATWKLPPLILYPFSDAAGPQKLAQSSRAGLILDGLLPRGESSVEELERTLVEGRMCEIRMLFYVGRDLSRWLEQCVDFASREADLAAQSLTAQSFADLLIEDAPATVREKLTVWGVVDYKSIFSRALGINAMFAEVPQPEQLGADFIRHYFRFADQLYLCRRSLTAYSRALPGEFDFDLYASGEYSRMLEREWADSGGLE